MWLKPQQTLTCKLIGEKPNDYDTSQQRFNNYKNGK